MNVGHPGDVARATDAVTSRTKGMCTRRRYTHVEQACTSAPSKYRRVAQDVLVAATRGKVSTKRNSRSETRAVMAQSSSLAHAEPLNRRRPARTSSLRRGDVGEPTARGARRARAQPCAGQYSRRARACGRALPPHHRCRGARGGARLRRRPSRGACLRDLRALVRPATARRSIDDVGAAAPSVTKTSTTASRHDDHHLPRPCAEPSTRDAPPAGRRPPPTPRPPVTTCRLPGGRHRHRCRTTPSNPSIQAVTAATSTLLRPGCPVHFRTSAG